MKKKLFAAFLACLMIISMSNFSVSAVAASGQTEEVGILYYGPESIRITAKESDLERFFEASSVEEKAQVVHDLVSNPDNTVVEYSELPFEVVSINPVDEGQDTIATRSPGTWKIQPFTLASNAYTYIGPTGGTAFDVAYNESVRMTYYCSPDRAISVELSQSVPTFYDPDFHSGTTTSWYPGVSGQYRIYFKNYSSEMAYITGGTVKIS